LSRHPRFLGHRLETFRAARGLTEAELAELLGVEPTALRHLALCFVPRGEADAEALAAEYKTEPGAIVEVCQAGTGE
jgi:transcriptional regulator with XRE-family HTH domain